jgi:hypothetical protein
VARQLVIEVIGEASKFVKSLNDAEEKSKSFGDKVTDAGKKMTAFATVPIVGFLGAATKAAADDAAAQESLAKTLANTAGNSAALAKQVEGYITAAQKVSTFTDDDLRPAFENLVRVTNNAQDANNLLTVAMDVAAAKHIDLATASQAVAKAHEGNFAAVNKLVPGLVDVKDKTLTAEQAMGQLASTFGGSAAAATDTAAGKAQMMQRDLGELTESIGTALLPTLNSLIGVIRPLIDWFQNLSSGTQKMIVFAGLAVAAIGPMIGAVTALSGAMAFLAANPVVLVIAAVAALAAGLVYAYKNSETFRDLVNSAFDAVKTAVATMWQVVQPIFDLYVKYLQTIWNVAGKVADVAGKIGGAIGGVVSHIPGFAAGGTVPGPPGMPVPAIVHGGEQIIPYGQTGGGGGGAAYSIVVNALDPSSAADAVIRAIDDYEARNGSRYARA